jgi:hypothetical protein
MRLFCLILIPFLIYSCNTSDDDTNVTIDPAGTSIFYIINSNPEPYNFKIIENNSVVEVLLDSIFSIEPGDTIKLGEYGAFSSPYPNEYFDSIMVKHFDSTSFATRSLSDTSEWQKIVISAGHPSTFAWYYRL